MQNVEMLEQNLWNTETRFDPSLMDAIFAPDFEEFGRSGRRYQRDDLIFSESQAHPIDATLHRMQNRALSDSLCLLTYVSEFHTDGSTEWANRSSILCNACGKWQLRFHQGTPCAPLTYKES